MSAYFLINMKGPAAGSTAGPFYHAFIIGLSRCLSQRFATVKRPGQASDQLPELGKRNTPAYLPVPSPG